MREVGLSEGGNGDADADGSVKKGFLTLLPPPRVRAPVGVRLGSFLRLSSSFCPCPLPLRLAPCRARLRLFLLRLFPWGGFGFLFLLPPPWAGAAFGLPSVWAPVGLLGSMPVLMPS